MSDINEVDLTALRVFLQDGSDFGCECGSETAKGFLSTLTALVAERNAIKQRVAELEKSAFYIPPKHPPADRDRELRERDDTLTKWMDQVTAMLCHSMTHSHDAKQELVTRCDAAIAAMRKGES